MKIKLILIASVCPQPVIYGARDEVLLPLLLVCHRLCWFGRSQRNQSIWSLTWYPAFKKGERNLGEFSTQSINWATVLCNFPKSRQQICWHEVGLDYGSRVRKAAITANYLGFIKNKPHSYCQDFPEHLGVSKVFLLTSVQLSQFRRWKPVAWEYWNPSFQT